METGGSLPAFRERVLQLVACQNPLDWWSANQAPRVRGEGGGRIYEEHIDGRQFQWGKVLELDPPRRARFTFHPSRPESAAQTIELLFHPEVSGARLELIATGWENWGKGAQRARRGYQVGWGLVLNLWAGRITMRMRLINCAEGEVRDSDRIR